MRDITILEQMFTMGKILTQSHMTLLRRATGVLPITCNSESAIFLTILISFRREGNVRLDIPLDRAKSPRKVG